MATRHTISFEVEGMDDCLLKLDELAQVADPAKVGSRIILPALREGAAVLKQAALDMVPTETFALYKSAKVGARKAGANDRRSKYYDGETALSTVTFGGKKAKDVEPGQALAVEFGTANRAPTPFLRPAFELKHTQAMNAVKDELGIRIDKFVKQLSKQKLGK